MPLSSTSGEPEPIEINPRLALDPTVALRRLEAVLQDYLDVQIKLPQRLVNAMSEEDAVEVEANVREIGTIGCEAIYLPTIEQTAVNGDRLQLLLITIDKKGNRLSDRQAHTLSKLISAGFRQVVSFPIFFYPTGAVMVVTVNPVNLAKLAYAYSIESLS